MKNRGRKIGVTVIAAIVFGVCAFFFYESFFHFVLSLFGDDEVSFRSTTLAEQFREFYTFIGVISMLPALFLFAHFILKDQKYSVFVFIVPITLLCGIVMMSFHIYSLKTEVTKLHEYLPMFSKNIIQSSDIHAARHLGIGFVLGTIFSTAILSFTTRDRKS